MHPPGMVSSQYLAIGTQVTIDVKRQKAPYIDIQMSRPRKTFWALLELKMRLHCSRMENLTVSWVKLYEMTVARRDWRNW